VTPIYDDENLPEMTGRRMDAIREALLTQVRDEPVTNRMRRRRRFALWGGVGILAVGGVAIAGTAIVQSQEVSNREVVHCLSSAERGVNGKFDESSATLSRDAGKAGRVDDAIALCSAMWQQGVFEHGFDPLSATHAPGTAPTNLRVCVMDDGSAAVVPGRPGVCSALGLAPESN